MMFSKKTLHITLGPKFTQLFVWTLLSVTPCLLTPEVWCPGESSESYRILWSISGRRRECDTAHVSSSEEPYALPSLHLRGGIFFMPDTLFISTDFQTGEATFVLWARSARVDILWEIFAIQTSFLSPYLEHEESGDATLPWSRTNTLLRACLT